MFYGCMWLCMRLCVLYMFCMCVWSGGDLNLLPELLKKWRQRSEGASVCLGQLQIPVALVLCCNWELSHVLSRSMSPCNATRACVCGCVGKLEATVQTFPKCFSFFSWCMNAPFLPRLYFSPVLESKRPFLLTRNTNIFYQTWPPNFTSCFLQVLSCFQLPFPLSSQPYLILWLVCPPHFPALCWQSVGGLLKVEGGKFGQLSSRVPRGKIDWQSNLLPSVHSALLALYLSLPPSSWSIYPSIHSSPTLITQFHTRCLEVKVSVEVIVSECMCVYLWRVLLVWMSGREADWWYRWGAWVDGCDSVGCMCVCAHAKTMGIWLWRTAVGGKSFWHEREGGSSVIYREGSRRGWS